MSHINSVDWNYWLAIPQQPIWSVVALSLTRDPHDVMDRSKADMGGNRTFPRESSTFCERINIACANLTPVGELVLVAKSERGVCDCKVKLIDFIKWATQQSWEIPENLTDFMTSSTRFDPVKVQWPWGDYSNRELIALADVIQNFWTTHIPNETTPTRSLEIEDFVKKRYPDIGRGAAQRIARISFPDGAKRGGRPPSGSRKEINRKKTSR